jgi:hypothetical protein
MQGLGFQHLEVIMIKGSQVPRRKGGGAEGSDVASIDDTDGSC